MSASTVQTIDERSGARAATDRSLRILFITGRFPHPALKGDQLRALQQIRRLADRHRVTLVYLTRGAPADHAPLARFCERIVAVPFGHAAMARGLLGGLFSSLPLQASLYQTEAMRAALRGLRGESFDLVHVQLARMAPYLEEGVCPRPWVVDLVDALSLGMDRRVAEEWGPWRWVARLEAERLRRYERQVAATVDQAMVVSPRDLAALGATRGLALVPNAVDLEAFPCSRHDREPATVVFTGNMGYFPNVTAAVWFAKEAFPLIRQAVPEARFVVVGARPARSVRALAADPAVTVTGRVDDVGPFLRRATVAVAPMRTGSGQQIKILEAMASGVPVVATPAEADQVGATHDQELLVASGARAFADAVIALFRDEARADRLARNARRLVETRFTWEHSMAALAGVYEAALEGRGKAASAAPRAS